MRRDWKVKFINNGQGNCSKNSPAIPRTQISALVLTCLTCRQVNDRIVLADGVQVSFEGDVLSVEQVPM